MRRCSSPAELQLSAVKCGNDKEQSGSSSDIFSSHLTHTPTTAHTHRCMSDTCYACMANVHRQKKKVDTYYRLIDTKLSRKPKYFTISFTKGAFLISQAYFDTRMTRSESDQPLILLHLVNANTLASHSLHNSFVQGRTHSWEKFTQSSIWGKKVVKIFHFSKNT